MRGDKCRRLARRGSALTTIASALVLAVNADSGAARGLETDPYVQVGAALTGSSMAGSGLFGAAGAISGDASTVLIGAPTDGASGTAYVFTPAVTGWVQQAALTDPSLPSSAYLGDSVALSANGGIALVGAPNAGEVLVFSRTGTTWSLESTIAAPATITGFGTSVSLSADGATALIGDNGSSGASNVTTAIVFDFVGGSWHEQAVLSPSGEAGNGSTFNPASVALSADASTALLGNAADDGGIGSAWVFAQSGGTWSAQGGRLTGSGEIGTGGFGGGTALSADGDTAAIGAIYDNCNDGAGYVFARSAGTWTQQSSKLTNIGLLGACGVGGPTFGEGAALSGDGTSAFFGGGDSALFTLSGSAWGQAQTDFAGGGATSLSSDGQTGLTTCSGCNGGAGTAYVYHFTAGAALPAPVAANLQVSHAVMAGVRIAVAGRAVHVRYKVNVNATARLQVLEHETGVSVNGDCVSKKSGTGTACSRYVPVTFFTLAARRGENSFTVPASAIPAAGGYEVRLIVMRPGSRANGLAMKPFTIKG
jgi:hypothetical protein